MRPADAIFAAHPNHRTVGDAAAGALDLAPVALGVPVCALCRDPEAAPTLAGDRAYGPDHLYLVCDRCGGRWQRWDA
ncbi:MAG TPA: hypothetical protein VFW03_13550 [Gemmatimonadaceae bacterium]|nr:hypothetical protein [Gemmatimonadaceae bacterium]